MAKEHRKGNREVRKQASVKPKPAAQVSQFERALTTAAPKRGTVAKQPRKS